MSNETQLFVDLCLAMAVYNRDRSDVSRRALREAQLAAEGRFGAMNGETDVALMAALALCVEEGVMAVYWIVTPSARESAHLRVLTESYPEVVAAARAAVRSAIGGSR
jgi:hypothetical protein